MKLPTLVKRHGGDFHVFRSLAIAQAIAGHVAFECFAEHERVLALTPSIKFKHPHGPHSRLVEKQWVKYFDPIVDLDPPGIIDFEMVAAGVPWWEWTKAKVNLPALKEFPVIEYLDQTGPAIKGEFVLIAPLSPHANPYQINAVKLEAWVRDQYPNASRFWVVPGSKFIGSNRPLYPYETLPQLAEAMRRATAVISVNGLVAAMANSTTKEGTPLVADYVHITEWTGTGLRHGSGSVEMTITPGPGRRTIMHRPPGAAPAPEDFEVLAVDTPK